MSSVAILHHSFVFSTFRNRRSRFDGVDHPHCLDTLGTTKKHIALSVFRFSPSGSRSSGIQDEYYEIGWYDVVT